MDRFLGMNTLNTLDLRQRLTLVEGRSDAKTFDRAIGVFEIYIPTDLGGTLEVGFGELWNQDAGDEIALWLPGKAAQNFTKEGKLQIQIKPGDRGDGYVYAVVKAVSPRYPLYAKFTEVGFARLADGSPLIPWNFWYFPTAESRRIDSVFGPRYHPLEKYERAFGVRGARSWERENHSNPLDNAWEGHCDFAARASIVFEPPPPGGVVHRGVHFTAEELKFLATEFAARYLDIDDVGYGIPGAYADDVPTKAELGLSHGTPSEDPELFGRHPRALRALLEMLRTQLRDRGLSVVMDLRHRQGPHADKSQERVLEKWNQAVYMYTTLYLQEHSHDPSLVRGTTRIYANDDFELDGRWTGDPATVVDGFPVPNTTVISNGSEEIYRGRQQRADYQLRYDRRGRVDWSSYENRWIGCYEVDQCPSFPEEKRCEQWIPRYAVGVGATLHGAGVSLADGNPHIRPEDVLSLLPSRKEYR